MVVVVFLMGFADDKTGVDVRVGDLVQMLPSAVPCLSSLMQFALSRATDSVAAPFVVADALGGTSGGGGAMEDEEEEAVPTAGDPPPSFTLLVAATVASLASDARLSLWLSKASLRICRMTDVAWYACCRQGKRRTV